MQGSPAPIIYTEEIFDQPNLERQNEISGTVLASLADPRDQIESLEMGLTVNSSKSVSDTRRGYTATIKTTNLDRSSCCPSVESLEGLINYNKQYYKIRLTIPR
jgi:hypothetical protein